MRRILCLPVAVFLLLSPLCIKAASISYVRAWPIKGNGVGINTGFKGRFGSVFLGSLGLLRESYLGGSWDIRYKVELRKEKRGWPDEVVSACTYTYTIRFPQYGTSEFLTISLVSSEAGHLETEMLAGTEAVKAVTNLGRIGSMDHVILPYQWSSSDADHTFHVKVMAEMDVPIEVDDRTEWKRSSSFAIPGGYCRSTYEGRNIGEEIIGTLGFDNPPKTPRCCYLSNSTVKINEIIRIAFETYDPDDEDECYVTVVWGDTHADRGSLSNKSPQWQSVYFTHRYRYPGVYTIKAFAWGEKDAKSGWSDPIVVRVED